MSKTTKKFKIPGPLLITGIYFIFGFLWIVLSDTLLYRLFPEPEIYNRLQTVKGWLYVALTTGLVYFLVGIYASRKNRLLSAARDREESAVVDLRNKELLVREIHHRSKNNLQLIKSLLRISLEEQACDEAGVVQDISSRIDSIALIHDQIYSADSFEKVEMDRYLSALANRITALAKNVAVRTELETLELEIDHAILCGIIVNEMVTNSLKYAFPAGQSGEIIIGLGMRDGKRLISVSDNGVGFDTSRPKSSFGLQLTELLANQLQGAMILESDSAGTRFALAF